MSDNLEMPKTFAELESYTSRILASQQAAHEAEIAMLKEEIHKLRIIYAPLGVIECASCGNLTPVTEEGVDHICDACLLSAANKACAMKDAALKTCISVDIGHPLGQKEQMFNEPPPSIRSTLRIPATSLRVGAQATGAVAGAGGDTEISRWEISKYAETARS